MKAGFIGLGSMGAPIARRLARSGFTVVGCDNSPEMLAAFDEPGTETTTDLKQCASGAELLGICVRTDDQLKAVVDGGSLFAALGSGNTLMRKPEDTSASGFSNAQAPRGLTQGFDEQGSSKPCVILHSTVSPDLARELAALAREYGVGFVDVGVSGGGPAAIEGKLSLWIGGEDDDVARARPWLEAIGSKLSHLGPVGRGQEGKLINNLISIANYGMSAAIVDIGIDMGFDRQELIDALNAGSAQSFALGVGPRFVLPREGHGAPGSFMGLHDLLKKDVDHARELPTKETVARDSLAAAAEFMLARIRRAAAEAEGQPPAPAPSELADRYFAAVRAKDVDAYVGLFAEDASYTVPNGKTVNGHAEIRKFQTMVFASGSPSPSPQHMIAASDGLVVEVAAHLPDGTIRRTANVFQLNDAGKITSLNVYARG